MNRCHIPIANIKLYIRLHILSSFGGKTTQKVVSGILANLLTKQFATNINFIGSNDKFSFKNSYLCRIVVGKI